MLADVACLLCFRPNPQTHKIPGEDTGAGLDHPPFLVQRKSTHDARVCLVAVAVKVIDAIYKMISCFSTKLSVSISICFSITL